MKLLDIRENAITAELDWGDVKLLTHVIEYAMKYDVMSDAADWGMAIGYLESTLAFLKAAGMASWAQTVEEKEYTLEEFLAMTPITSKERRRWEARCREAQREHQRERAEEEARKAEAPPAA